MPSALSTEASEEVIHAEVHRCLQTRTCPLDMESSQEDVQTVLLETPWEGEQRGLSQQPLQLPGIWEGPSWGPRGLSWALEECSVGVTTGKTTGACSAEWRQAGSWATRAESVTQQCLMKIHILHANSTFSILLCLLPRKQWGRFLLGLHTCLTTAFCRRKIYSRAPVNLTKFSQSLHL